MFLRTYTSLFVIANLPSAALHLTTHIILILFFRATYILATLAILVVPVCFLQQTCLKKEEKKISMEPVICQSLTEVDH